MTNGEKMRAITNDELAEMIYRYGLPEFDTVCNSSEKTYNCENDKYFICEDKQKCIDCIKKWLDKETEK